MDEKKVRKILKEGNLHSRMKRYEASSKAFLMRRTPAIIRVDGKAFHTFTKDMKAPFDERFRNAMQQTMLKMCQNIQGCVFGYTQSDEISFVLTDYETLTTDAWYDYNVQKMTSIAASMATLYFAEALHAEVDAYAIRLTAEQLAPLSQFATERSNYPSGEMQGTNEYISRMRAKMFAALFDARAFSVPKEEVCNCMIWRQQDATRNSIQSVGQYYFSQSQLNRKSLSQIQEMLWAEAHVNWNDIRTEWKRGACCYRDDTDSSKTHFPWIIDKEPPIFTQNRNYIERWI